MTIHDIPRPRRLDSRGHSLMRLIMRRPDVIEARSFDGTVDVNMAFFVALDAAELVKVETSRLSTWRVFDDVLISVDRNGIVTTVHHARWEPSGRQQVSST